MLVSMVSLAESSVQSLPSDYVMEKYQTPKTVRFSRHPFTWAKLKYLKWKGREVMVTETRQSKQPEQLPMLAPEEFTIISEEPRIQKSEVVEKRMKRVDPKIDQDSIHDELEQDVAQFNIIPQDIDLRPVIKKAIEKDCGDSVRKYHDEWAKDPKSRYKKWQYESWLKQCQGEKKAR